MVKSLAGRKLSPLKLLVMSATLDTKWFCEYFNGAKAIYVQGRQFHVEIFYTYTAEADYLDAALLTTFQIHLKESPGDILLFLTGQEEIESVELLLKERAANLPQSAPKVLVVPIYAALPSEQQMRVLTAPEGTCKVILATNIAETSLTIPGIPYVVDPGLMKARAYNPRTGVESLAIVPVSKAQAQQRRALGSGQTVSTHPSSVLLGKKHECVVFDELVRTNCSYIRNLTQIDSLWLPELPPQYYAAREVAHTFTTPKFLTFDSQEFPTCGFLGLPQPLGYASHGGFSGWGRIYQDGASVCVALIVSREHEICFHESSVPASMVVVLSVQGLIYGLIKSRVFNVSILTDAHDHDTSHSFIISQSWLTAVS